MKTSILRSGLSALALGGVLASATALPASADTNTTRNIVYGAAAAAFTLYNVERKHQLATSVQGYLPDGSTVYRDGHVVSPGGYSWYPGNNGQTVACSNQYCTIQGGYNNAYGYNNGYNSGYNYSNGYNAGYNSNGYNAGYSRNGQRLRGHRDGDGHGG